MVSTVFFLPKMGGKGCRIFTWVIFKACFVFIKSGLKFTCQPNVSFLLSFAILDCGLINYPLLFAGPWKGAFMNFALYTVTFWRWGGTLFSKWISEYFVVVFWDMCPHIWKALIPYFHCLPVYNGMKTVSRGEVFVYEFQKFPSNICGHVYTVWWVKPCYILFPLLILFLFLILLNGLKF